MNTSPLTEIAAVQSPSASSAAGFRRRRRRTAKIAASCGDGEKEISADDEKAEVEKKIVALQKIVPGGERLPVEELFEETAEYIFALESQIEALRFLAAFVQTSEKRKRKLGG